LTSKGLYDRIPVKVFKKTGLKFEYPVSKCEVLKNFPENKKALPRGMTEGA
jgi:hypothetical protein